MSEHTPLNEAERIEAMLAAHRLGSATGKPWYQRPGGTRNPRNYAQTYACKCGRWEGTHGDHLAHVADALAARTSTATADTGLRERVEALLADEWHDEPPSPTYPEGRRIYRWPADLRDELRAALDVTAAPSLDLRARVEALADDLWRVTPCGCGHRADLHTMGGLDGVSVCTGGLGICGCDWSFVRIVQQRIRDLLATAAPTTDTGARDE